MSKALTKAPRSLAKLSPMIRKELKAGFQAGDRHWKTVGRLLNEARQHFPKSGPSKKGLTWYQWVDREFVHPMTNQPLGHSTVRQWMLGASKNGSAGTRHNLTAHTDRRSPDHKDHNSKLDWKKGVRKVQQKINVDQLRKQLATERQQTAERVALAGKIVEAGYRALSAVVHPDRQGGSPEAMKKLTETKKWLKEQIIVEGTKLCLKI